MKREQGGESNAKMHLVLTPDVFASLKMMLLPLVAMMRCLPQCAVRHTSLGEAVIIGGANIICRRQTSFKKRTFVGRQKCVFCWWRRNVAYQVHNPPSRSSPIRIREFSRVIGSFLQFPSAPHQKSSNPCANGDFQVGRRRAMREAIAKVRRAVTCGVPNGCGRPPRPARRRDADAY